VIRTKNHDTWLEYRASEGKSAKWVEKKGLTYKTLSKNLLLLISPRSILSRKKQIATTNNGCNTYYYGKRIGMIMESMHAWHDKYDAMQLIQIKRNRNPDTHIWFKLFYYSANLNVD
jgi:hypothetical protein